MSRPWMPLYIADYLKDTTHLGALESGAYLHLIMDYWQNGRLPGEDRLMARIAKLTDREWKKSKAVLQSFFYDGWKHKRIDEEIAHTAEVSNKRSAIAAARQAALRVQQESKESAIAPPIADTLHTSQSKEDSAAIAAGANAPVDHRKRLFDEGLPKLATMTGKGPDACRSFVGKCLKACGDDAITVLGLIEDAERNRVANASAWIVARLGSNGSTGPPPTSKGGFTHVLMEKHQERQNGTGSNEPEFSEH